MPNGRNQIRRVTNTLHYRVRAGALAGLGYWGESYVDAVMDKAKELWGEGQQATQDMLDEMRQKVAQFQADWASFRVQRAHYYELGLNAAYDEVYEIGAKVERTIASTLNAYRDLKSWMGLGFLPLIGAAVIAALIAAIAYYFTRRQEIAAAERQRMAELQLVREGQMTPEEYYSGAPQPEPGVIQSASSLAKWIVIGGAVGLVGYPLIKRYLR